ncbi:MAG: large subunit ribosomal protein L30e [Methanosarcinales archaeon]|nr:MAG: 50S ribosomal protein L30e [Euryarchaeota archaeon 55_53]KUK30418.1 MAG: 50S ribosomal protein L30e [Methanosarcinales archeaon 56_1174]MDI3488303.1 large subunit ribosomal protein L30e [Methanosarcinales archaeon]MDN5295328.1 large subunit ribosomal protein L30e [Methanosarcinales archaeon]
MSMGINPMGINLNKELMSAVKTGKVLLGSKQSLKAVSAGNAKLVVVASNCPPSVKRRLEEANVPIIRFDGTGVDLGTVCGKPFAIAALAIVEEGESEILAGVR